MYGYNYHPRHKRLYRIAQRQTMVYKQLIGEPLRYFDLRREYEIRVVEFKTQSGFEAKIYRAHFEEFVGILRPGICSHVIFKFATQDSVKPELLMRSLLNFT